MSDLSAKTNSSVVTRTIMSGVADIAWREYNIHDDGDTDNDGGKKLGGEHAKEGKGSEDDEEEAMMATMFNMFDDPNDERRQMKMIEFKFYNRTTNEGSSNNSSRGGDNQHVVDDAVDGGGGSEADQQQQIQTIIKLKCQDDYTNSSGMSIWRGAEVLCEYLQDHSKLIKDKTVLELGSGVGLCGIIVHKLGARRVLVTDGDIDVLNNLRENVQINCPTSNNDNNSVSCPQLIWGKNLNEFKKLYGTSQVIIATDVMYITASIHPLFQTVRELLATNENDKEEAQDDDGGGVFICVNLNDWQAPMETVLDIAKQYDFTWTYYTNINKNNKADDTSNSTSVSNVWEQDNSPEEEEKVYLFRRRGRR